jgi:hypothetical protein
MSLANPRWGASRIHGELLKLGFELWQTTVAKYMVRHRRPPSQTWRTFLRNYMKDMVAVDFFVAPTAFFELLFAFVILSHDPPPARPLCGHRTSDGGMGGSATVGSLPVGQRAALSATRSGWKLRREVS